MTPPSLSPRIPLTPHARIRAAADDPCISVQPPALTVPALGTAALDVTVTAPDASGPLRSRLLVSVDHGHGPPVPVEVRATVGAAHASLLVSRLDFGLVRLNGRGERALVIRNRSTTSATPWSLRELTPAVIAAVRAGFGRGTWGG